MTDQSDPTPAVWDPAARDGAGGWVRRPAAASAAPVTPPPAEPAVSRAPLTARPLLQSFLDAPAVPPTPPTPPPAAPPAAQEYPPPPAQSPYQQPYQPYEGAEPLPLAPQRPARRSPLLVGAGVLLLLAVAGGAALALHGGSSSTKAQANPLPPAATGSTHPSSAPSASTPGSAGTPTAAASASTGAGPNALAQAQALDSLLTRGEAAKAPIGSAVAMVSSCPAKADIDSAAQVFDTAATQRAQLLTDLGKLSFSDLPGGADAAQSLKTAWQQSESIDQAYEAWAKTVSAQGCGATKTAPDTPDKQNADALNPQATQSKQDFVTKWNALASTYGLAPRTSDRI